MLGKLSMMWNQHCPVTTCSAFEFFRTFPSSARLWGNIISSAWKKILGYLHKGIMRMQGQMSFINFTNSYRMLSLISFILAVYQRCHPVQGLAWTYTNHVSPRRMELLFSPHKPLQSCSPTAQWVHTHWGSWEHTGICLCLPQWGHPGRNKKRPGSKWAKLTGASPLTFTTYLAVPYLLQDSSNWNIIQQPNLIINNIF